MTEGRDQQPPAGAAEAGAAVLERPDAPAAGISAPAAAEPPAVAEPAAAEAPADPTADAPPSPAARPAAPAPLVLPSRRIDYLLFAASRLAETLLLVALAGGLLWLILPGEGAAPSAALTERLGVTLPLVGLSLAAAIFAGLPLGLLALSMGRRGALLGGALALAASLSPLVLGLCGLIVFAGLLAWLPPGGFVPWSQDGWAALVSLALPALSLALPLGLFLAAALWRGGRAPLLSGTLERAAEFGLSRRKALAELVLPPALAAATAQMLVPVMLVPAFALAIEAAFYLPGLSRALLEALAARDAAALRTPLLTLVALGAACRLGLELVRGALDPDLTDRR